jgi:hypothetical protein
MTWRCRVIVRRPRNSHKRMPLCAMMECILHPVTNQLLQFHIFWLHCRPTYPSTVWTIQPTSLSQILRPFIMDQQVLFQITLLTCKIGKKVDEPFQTLICSTGENELDESVLLERRSLRHTQWHPSHGRNFCMFLCLHLRENPKHKRESHGRSLSAAGRFVK